MITVQLGSTFREMAEGVAALKAAGLEADVAWTGGQWVATIHG